MAAWRKRLIELFPHKAADWSSETSVYLALGTLLHEVVLPAHKENDEDALRKAYGFAAWCFAQPALVNAAGVSFYEHLPDDPDTLEQMPRWVSPAIFSNVQELIRGRITESQWSALLESYRKKHGRNAIHGIA